MQHPIPLAVARAARYACLALLVACLLAAGAARAEGEGERRGFLYEVRKGAQVALLFGTIHVGRPEFYPLPSARMAHMQRFDALVLEADITDTERSLLALRRHAFYPDGAPGLDARLGPDLRRRLERLLATAGLDPAPLMRMKPWMLATALALHEAGRAGFAPSLSVEGHLAGLARAAGKPILELEGVDRQFALFEQAPWPTQLAFLDETLQSIEAGTARREIGRVVAAWAGGDAGGLGRLLAEMSAQTTPGARFTVDTLLAGRHDAMLRRMEALMTDGRTHLFAVGALHLPGPRGLVEGLRARGYTVTAL